MKRYNVIVADPPWSYDNKNTGGSLKSGSNAKYPTLSLAEIHKLDVPRLCAANSILALWATTPLIEEALAVMYTWGFKYKTMWYWIKYGRLGMGFWFRGNVEMCLIGVRGDVRPFRIQEKNYFVSRPTGHSEKPKRLMDILTRATKAPRLELFARTQRPGWDAMGFEFDGKDIRETLKVKS